MLLSDSTLPANGGTVIGSGAETSQEFTDVRQLLIVSYTDTGVGGPPLASGIAGVSALSLTRGLVDGNFCPVGSGPLPYPRALALLAAGRPGLLLFRCPQFPLLPVRQFVDVQT